MRTLFGSMVCVGLMSWTPNSTYARGGTYHHAEFVPFSSITTIRKPAPPVTERHKCRWFAGRYFCTRRFPLREPMLRRLGRNMFVDEDAYPCPYRPFAEQFHARRHGRH